MAKESAARLGCTVTTLPGVRVFASSVLGHWQRRAGGGSRPARNTEQKQEG